MTDRRGFLRGIVMGMASGIILPSAAEALVMGDRYNRLVTAISALLDTHQRIEAFRHAIPDVPTHLRGNDIRKFKREFGIAMSEKRIALRPTHQANFDEYIRIIVKEFGDTTPLVVDYDAAMLSIAQVFVNPKMLDIMSEADLRKHEDIVIAVGTMRSLLAVHGISTLDINIRDNPHTEIFSERYPMLLGVDFHEIVRRHTMMV